MTGSLPLALVLVTGGVILVDGLNNTREHADVGIVLGSAVDENGNPSPRLRSRLDKAAELYRAGRFNSVLVSGGVDRRGHDEAGIMRDYLIACGLPASDVIADYNGRTTWLTAANAQKIMHDRELQSAMVITQWFHIARTKLALRRFGIRCTECAHADRLEWRDMYSFVREIAAYLSYIFKSAA